MVQNEQLRARGVLYDEDTEIELDEASRRFGKLFQEEQQRRAAVMEAREAARRATPAPPTDAVDDDNYTAFCRRFRLPTRRRRQLPFSIGPVRAPGAGR